MAAFWDMNYYCYRSVDMWHFISQRWMSMAEPIQTCWYPRCRDSREMAQSWIYPDSSLRGELTPGCTVCCTFSRSQNKVANKSPSGIVNAMIILVITVLIWCRMYVCAVFYAADTLFIAKQSPEWVKKKKKKITEYHSWNAVQKDLWVFPTSS